MFLASVFVLYALAWDFSKFCVCFCVLLGFIFKPLAKRLAGKSISEMT